MLYIKAAGKAVQIGLHSSLPPSDSSSSSSSNGMAAWGAIRPRRPQQQHPSPRVPQHPWPSCCHQCYPGYGRAETAAPRHGLAIQVHTVVLVLDTSQYVKGLVKELVYPRGDVWILRPKEGINCHEGREICDEVPGYNRHLRQFGSRFR